MPPQPSTNLSKAASAIALTSARVPKSTGILQVQSSDVPKAEVLWVLKNVSCHYSYHSSEKINRLFQAMFPDSSIASNFQCGETKTAYIAAYGLAPFFKNQLVSQINSLSMPQFVYMFDESLCKATQTKQMDCHVRFWNDSRKLVTRRYLGAQFIGHGDAAKLVDCCHESHRGLHEKNILQISMDGPNVNWKFYEDVCNDIFSDDMSPQPLQLGSCRLHILHGIFKDGMSASGWDLKSFFWSLRQFMKDSPARREDYTEITGSSLFPLKFCVHRWVENVPVVQRAIEITLLMDTFLKTLAKKKDSKEQQIVFHYDKFSGGQTSKCKDVFLLVSGKTVSHILETLSNGSTNGSISGKGS